MFKKSICAIVLTATLFLSGCSPLLYTPEFEDDMSERYLAEAEAWMLENIDGATNLTYELYTNKYVSSIVKGQFEISDIVYNYAFDVDSDKLYANTNKHGVTSSDVVSILDECLSEYYADTNIEISRVDVSWQIPCNLYHDKSSVDSETDEVASEVIQSDGWLPYSYIDWDITRDELKTLWSDILYGRADMHRKISVTATYGTYTDIKDEIHSMNVLQFHPGISNIKFKPVEMVDDEYFELSRDKDVLVAYRHYTYENSQGESEWSCETIR